MPRRAVRTHCIEWIIRRYPCEIPTLDRVLDGEQAVDYRTRPNHPEAGFAGLVRVVFIVIGVLVRNRVVASRRLNPSAQTKAQVRRPDQAKKAEKAKEEESDGARRDACYHRELLNEGEHRIANNAA